MSKIYSQVWCRRISPQGINEVLLATKKYGFGAGKFQAYAGKLDSNETPSAAAIRELYEESGIKANFVTEKGYLEFNMNESMKILKIYVFECWDFNAGSNTSH
jgi:8-oxo-dGTP pyrophosphatase MutT (NUDIX family)